MGYTGYVACRGSHLQIADRFRTAYFLYLPSIVYRSALCRNRHHAEGHQERSRGNKELKIKISPILFCNIQFSCYNSEHYELFLQNYWWFLVSLLGALLVFLLFVQGGNSLLFTLGRNDEERALLVNSTGRKWEFTFTTLVTFGGAFFASFPLFYSTSFGGAYWLWMIILFSFVLQAVSYEFQSKLGNLLGKRTYQWFLVINGIVGPLLLGGAVATFFTGSNFLVNKGNMGNELMPVISSWANGWHGLDALANPWNLVLGFAVFFLARLLGNLYFINNIRDKELIPRCRRQLITDAVPFLILFLAFVIRTLLADGFAVNPETKEVYMEPYKYFINLMDMPL